MDHCLTCRAPRQLVDSQHSDRCEQCRTAPASFVTSSSAPNTQSGYTSTLAMLLFVVFGLFVMALPFWASEAERPMPVAATATPQPAVALYGTSWCRHCAKTRTFFRRNGIRYTEYDVERDTIAQQRYRDLHRPGVPVVVIADRVVAGYDPRAYADMLQPWMR